MAIAPPHPWRARRAASGAVAASLSRGVGPAESLGRGRAWRRRVEGGQGVGSLPGLEIHTSWKGQRGTQAQLPVGNNIFLIARERVFFFC